MAHPIRRTGLPRGGPMCTVLIVEDNPRFRQYLRELLEYSLPGLAIFEACDSREAFESLARMEPDLIFTDVRLPGMNGLELTRAVKKDKPHITVIVFTSYDLPEYRDAAFRSGASHFFTKGNANIDEIMNAVTTTLTQSGLEQKMRNFAVGYEI
ncbi:MAG: response regulator transcription factor [Desulfobacteraceae bacterium]|nr:response regulator transcription factor [Desulfobacteraceae bacterium]